jgi:hypothetical protein
LDTIELACAPSEHVNTEKFKDTLRSHNVADTIIQAHVKRRRANGESLVRPERNTWILDEYEDAAFAQAFATAQTPRALAATAARLTELHPEIGLVHQRALVLMALRQPRP